MSNLFVFKCLVGLKNHTACLFVMESHAESNRSVGEKKEKKVHQKGSSTEQETQSEEDGSSASAALIAHDSLRLANYAL